jgi:hypothetical protein
MKVTALSRLPICCLLVAVACSGARPSPSAAPPTTGRSAAVAIPDTRPIVDIAPYWCGLVPVEALTRVSGPGRGLVERRSPVKSPDAMVCGVRDDQRDGPLGVTWDRRDGRALLARALRQVADDHPRGLPRGLGSGFLVHSPRTSRLPYEVGALFRCGSRDVWMYLALRSVAPGRDAGGDLVGLMRVAQRRFGVVHRCAVTGRGPGSG